MANAATTIIIGKIWSSISKVYLGSLWTAVLIGWDPATLHLPAFGFIYIFYCSAKIDDISLWHTDYNSWLAETHPSSQKGASKLSISLWSQVMSRAHIRFSGGFKEMSSILADQQRPRIRAQMRGEWGSWGVSVKQYICSHGAQINFWDLTLYLTFDVCEWEIPWYTSPWRLPCCCSGSSPQWRGRYLPSPPAPAEMEITKNKNP